MIRTIEKAFSKSKDTTIKLNAKTKKVLRLTLLFLLFIFLILFSELIFIYKNQPSVFGNFYLWKAKNFAINREDDKAITYLYKAANISIEYNSKKYINLIPKSYYPKITVAQNDSLIEFLKNVKINKINNPEEYPLARVFYELGIIAINTKQDALFPIFLQTAVYIEPDLGHYYVELANYYLASGNKEMAKEKLEFCLKFEYPSKQCQEYIDNNLSTNSPDEIGFLKFNIFNSE